MQQHWETVYRSKNPAEVSWYCPHLETSIAMIERASAGNRAASVVDIGGGASTLVDDLLALGYQDITVLDISDAALNVAQERLGEMGKCVRWMGANLLECDLPEKSFDIWHDRAVFHFLTEPADRLAYVRQARYSLRPGGHLIVATFGPEGPNRCSGLDTVRYDSTSLVAEFGPQFRLVESATELHNTPFGAIQQFLYCHLVLSQSSS